MRSRVIAIGAVDRPGPVGGVRPDDHLDAVRRAAARFDDVRVRDRWCWA